MKNQTSSLSGFNPTMLPLTRKQQFKDQLKLNFSLFLRIGFILFIFAIPLILSFVGERFTINYYSSPEVTDKSGLIIYGLIFDFAKSISMIIFGIGLAGALRIYRKCIWNEPVLFRLDFKDGIKINLKSILFISVFTGLFFLIINFLFNYGIYSVENNSITLIAYILLVSIFAFVILPVFVMMIGLSLYYKNKILIDIKNGFILVIKAYIPFVFLSLLSLAPFFISFISNALIMFIILVIYFIVLLPIYLLGINLYLIHIFDENINSNFKEYQYKGLYKKGD